MGRDADRVSSGEEVVMGDKMTASIYPSIYSLYMLEMALVGRCACANLLGDTRVLLWLA